MTVSPEDVERVARLAAVGVDRDELPALTQQIGRILDFIAQLEAVDAAAAQGAFRPGPGAAPLRDDEPGSVPLERSLEDFAPEVRDGFVVVPRLEALGED